MKIYSYNFEDIQKAFEKINLKKSDTVYVSGNLALFGNCKIENIKELPNLFFKALIKKIGKRGTVVFPTHSFSLIKSKEIFSPLNSVSESGSFSNYLLKKKKMFRQMHPYASVAAIGEKAKFICSNNPLHVYGPFSPFDKMISLKSKFISLGLNINLNCTQVHHAEFMMNVPYRYTKEFIQKIKSGNSIKSKKFYMFLLYKKYLNMRRDKNKIIIKNFKKKNKVFKTNLGNSSIYSYDLRNFYEENIKLLKKNIYCWFGQEPKYKTFIK
jgi:aminoglycoside 3-N-acetyltransferase